MQGGATTHMKQTVLGQSGVANEEEKEGYGYGREMWKSGKEKNLVFCYITITWRRELVSSFKIQGQLTTTLCNS